MGITKKTLLRNNKFAVLSKGKNGDDNHYYLLQDDEALAVWRENDRLKGGDVVIELTEENVKVAIAKNLIELK